MTAFYTLWDIEVGNSLGTYLTEDEVLAVAHQLILANGVGYTDALEVGYQDEAGEWRLVASGSGLGQLLEGWAATTPGHASAVPRRHS
jgi:hypothetical protein